MSLKKYKERIDKIDFAEWNEDRALGILKKQFPDIPPPLKVRPELIQDMLDSLSKVFGANVPDDSLIDAISTFVHSTHEGYHGEEVI
jgi:hypothetical protein